MTDKLGVITDVDAYDSLLRWHYETKSDQIIGKKEYY